MAQNSHRILPSESQYNNVLRYTDANVNRTNRFRPSAQAQPVNNMYRSNQICHIPKLNNAKATVQLVHRSLGQNSLGIVFKNPNMSCAGTSRDNLNTSVDSRRSNDTIALGVPVQNKVAPLPKLAPITEASTSKKNTNEQNTTNENNAASGTNFKVYGSTENEKMFIFTGTVERVIRWNKIFQNHFCYFEVIAAVISIQEGSIRTQKIMLLRDRKGPILQMIYYGTTHLDIEDFHVGQILRCVGKMSAPNIFNAISIRAASQKEIDTLQRLCLVCDHAVSHFLNV